MSFVNKVFGGGSGGAEETKISEAMDERPPANQASSRIRVMSEEDATKAINWLNEQEEINSATYLSHGRSGDDMSSSMTTHDLNSVTGSSRPSSVTYDPNHLFGDHTTNLTNHPKIPKTNSGGIYPYGRRQEDDMMEESSAKETASRIRVMSEDDASKALRWLNEQEELNSASCLSRGKTGDDMSSSMATHDFNSITGSTRPPVAYVPTTLNNPKSSVAGDNYAYGSGQVPGVFSGFGAPHGEDPDNNTAGTTVSESEPPRETAPEKGSAPSNGNHGSGNTKSFADTPNDRSVGNRDNNHNTSNKVRGGGASFYWMEYLIYTVIAIAVQIALGRDFAFPDGLDDSTGKACNDVDANLKMCGLETTLQEAQAQVRILTPFILAGFVLVTVNLWKERRTSYLALSNAVRNINVQISSILPLPEEVPESESRRVIHARNTMSRWSLLGYELAILKARGSMEEESNISSHLKELGLLTDDEWEAMVPGDRHNTVWLWMQTKAMKLGHEKIIDQSIHLQTICNALEQIQQRSNDLMSSISHDQPMPYASVVGILVNYTLLLLSALKGVVRFLQL